MPKKASTLTIIPAIVVVLRVESVELKLNNEKGSLEPSIGEIPSFPNNPMTWIFNE